MSERSPHTLGSLRASPVPPAELEDRVVTLLKSKKLIHTGRGDRDMKMQYAINAAVAIVSVVLGLALGQKMDDVPPAAVSDAGEEFIMLLYEDETYQAPAPGGMEARIAEYSDWARQVAATGNYVTGEKLTDDATLLLADGSRVDAIPKSEEGALEGYFVIRAADMNEAAEIAGTCPHLAYGGTVSLRRLARGR